MTIYNNKHVLPFQSLVKNYDQDMDTLTKQQKQQVEKAETSQAVDLKSAAKRIKIEQVWYGTCRLSRKNSMLLKKLLFH